LSGGRRLVEPHGLLRPPATKLVVRFETTGDEDGAEDPRAEGLGDEAEDDTPEGGLDQALEQLFEMEPEAAEEATAEPAAGSLPSKQGNAGARQQKHTNP